MPSPAVAPYGSWRSPISADLITAGSVSLQDVAVDGESVYWVEMRPAEAGRYVVVRRTKEGASEDVTPAEFSARTTVHEYGGGAIAVSDGTLFFSNFRDQRIYRQDGSGSPRPITPEGPLRFADAVVDRTRDRLVCVCEDHGGSGREDINTLVSVNVDGQSTARTLVSGSDFYAAPRLSPDGSQLAWLSWDHPNMPWDGTELWLASLDAGGALRASRKVAGGRSESIAHPCWSPDGVLYFVSDRNGWWNLYRLLDHGAEAVLEMEAEFGHPAWVFGQSTYTFVSPTEVVCAVGEEGTWSLAKMNVATGALDRIATPFTQVGALHSSDGQVVLVAGSPRREPAIVRLNPESGEMEEVRRSGALAIDEAYFSAPESITFPTEEGLTAQAFYYPPRNPDCVAPAGERPPLIVRSHGGPTAATPNVLNPRIQYWTSRGFAVVDVNYGGSTGFGREYRQRLNGRWGVVDVDDCANAARYLVERGEADPRRLAISGGSAGGYTTLCALAFRDLFRAGASHYGVSDAAALARDTHKFESRYLDGLIGPYPERADLYRERSPIRFPEQLSCPVIFFQGLEDKIVPPDQAETMVEALRRRGIPVAYVAFEGEQHGFRQAKNIKRALEGELYFYSRVFGFELADAVEPIVIENL
ncbi:MAG: S9 family peptidase [Dehalococcoidia bacterium]